MYLRDDVAAKFASDYARAREIGYQKMAEEVIEISDEEVIGPDGYIDNGAVQRARLRAESRKWLLSKMLPKQFGDKVTQEITGDPDAPLVTRIELVPVARSCRGWRRGRSRRRTTTR
jgi:hypothetical protein